MLAFSVKVSSTSVLSQFRLTQYIQQSTWIGLNKTSAFDEPTTYIDLFWTSICINALYIVGSNEKYIYLNVAVNTDQKNSAFKTTHHYEG